MSWHLGRLASFDLETTGVDVETDRIVTGCLAQLGGNQPVQVTEWVADPGVEIPAQAAAIHGWTTERARAEGRPAAKVIAEITAALAQVQRDGLPLVVMNAPYDLTLLDREARRHGVTPLVDILGPDGLLVVDPKVLDKRAMERRRGKRTLTDLCQHYKVRIDGAHNSTADAVAAARVVWRIGQRYPQLAEMDVTALHAAQVVWAREQAESLQAHFRSLPGKENEVVDPSWPIRPLPAAVTQ